MHIIRGLHLNWMLCFYFYFFDFPLYPGFFLISVLASSVLFFQYSPPVGLATFIFAPGTSMSHFEVQVSHS